MTNRPGIRRVVVQRGVTLDGHVLVEARTFRTGTAIHVYRPLEQR